MFRFFERVLILGAVLFLIHDSEQLRDNYVGRARSSVVSLTDLAQTHGGTGFYIKAPSGRIYVLTNGHICEGSTNGYLLETNENGLKRVAKVIEEYSASDLCIVTAPYYATPLHVARYADANEDIYVIGHPLLEPLTMTKGQLSGDYDVQINAGPDIPCDGPGYKKVDAPPLAQIFFGVHYFCIRTLASNPVTATILPGNSGSPVLNKWGHVVGVAFASVESSVRGYIIPLSVVKEFLKDK